MKVLLSSWFLSITLVDIISAITDPNKFLIKYAMTKARESCVGEKLTRVWERQVRHIVEECRYGGVHHNGDHHLDDYSNIVIGPGPNKPGYSNAFPKIPPLGFIPDHALTLGNSGIGFNNVIVSNLATFGHSHSRKKRDSDHLDSALEGKNFLRNLVKGEKRILEQISNVTCILRNLNVIDDGGNLLLDAMIDATAQMPVDPQLKEDLLQGITQCSAFVSCLPPSNRPSELIPFELKRSYAFIKCSQLKRQMACVKKDIRTSVDQNFPRDLKGTINLENFSQRMLDVLMAEDVQEYEALLL